MMGSDCISSGSVFVSVSAQHKFASLSRYKRFSFFFFFPQSTTEVVCCAHFRLIRKKPGQQTRSYPGDGYSYQTVFSSIRLLLSLRIDFNLQPESQSHLFTSETCVNSFLARRQTAVVPQDPELNVTPASSTLGQAGLSWRRPARSKQVGWCCDGGTRRI